MPKSRLGRIKQRSVRNLVLIALKGMIFFLNRTPRRMGIMLGGYMGRMAFHVLVRERRRALSQFQMAMGDSFHADQSLNVVKSSFQNLGKGLVEAVHLARLTHSEVERCVEVEGEECLKEAKGRAKGVIFITAHLGNWEIGASSLSGRYSPTSIVAAPMYDPKIETLLLKVRERFGIETIVRNHPQALRRILSTIRKGGVVVFAIDQDTRTEGVFVPFFGRETYTPAGPATLALRTGASVVMGFSLRLPDDRHRVVIKGPIDLIRTGDTSGDVQANTARFSQIIEEFVRKYPEQWIWMHKRWKTVKSH